MGASMLIEYHDVSYAVVSRAPLAKTDRSEMLRRHPELGEGVRP
jgi:hypothetical protein